MVELVPVDHDPWEGSYTTVPVDHDPFEAAAYRQRQAVHPEGGRQIGLATRVPEAIAASLALGIPRTLMAGPRLMGDVAEGRLDLSDPEQAKEAAGRSLEAATSVMAPGTAFAPRGALGMAGSKIVQPSTTGPIKAFHSTYEPFEAFDWSRLGETTLPNVSGQSNEQWATNLAKLGPWASEKPDLGYGAPHYLSVEIGGKGKSFPSLDALEAAIRKSGGPEKFRSSLLEQGYGHVKVKDEEFGGKSFVALSPPNFRITGHFQTKSVDHDPFARQ